MTIAASFDLFKDIEKPPLLFQFAVGAVYMREKDASMSLEEIKDYMALAHMFPFVREFVANMTGRLPGHNQLFLPLMNTEAMVDSLKESQSPKS